MTLSSKAYHKLANSLKADIAKEIRNDERYINLLLSLISESLKTKLGPMEEELLFDLTYCVFDRMDLIPVKLLPMDT